MVNSAGAPQDLFQREVAYTNQQLARDVNPRYGWGAQCVVSDRVDPTKLCVALVGNVSAPNSFILPGTNYGEVHYNAATMADGSWPARLNHVVLNRLNEQLLIAQTFEAIDYNPVDFSQSQLDGLWWLCDWDLPSGTLGCFGHMGFQDFCETKVR